MILPFGCETKTKQRKAWEKERSPTSISVPPSRLSYYHSPSLLIWRRTTSGDWATLWANPLLLLPRKPYHPIRKPTIPGIPSTEVGKASRIPLVLSSRRAKDSIHSRPLAMRERLFHISRLARKGLKELTLGRDLRVRGRSGKEVRRSTSS